MKQYEGIFILKTGTDDEIKQTISACTEQIKKHNGTIIHEENWGKKPTPYPVKKEKEAVYYRLNFSLEPKDIKTIESAFRLNAKILRVTVFDKEYKEPKPVTEQQQPQQ